MAEPKIDSIADGLTRVMFRLLVISLAGTPVEILIRVVERHMRFPTSFVYERKYGSNDNIHCRHPALIPKNGAGAAVRVLNDGFL